jgi:hypothetical protein
MQTSLQNEAQSSLASQEFRPELISRRGELVGWGLTLLLAVAWVILKVNQQPSLGPVTFLAVFMFLSAASISLGNWMDRRTCLRLDAQSITFDNGLRHAQLSWQEIRRVEVYPSNWGKKVRVMGERAHFDFRTLGEVIVQGDLKGRMGFAQGEKILRTIVEQARLRRSPNPSGTGYYYSRE